MKNHRCEYHIKHTKERYLERFNDNLSDDEYDELCSLLNTENSIKISKHKYKNSIIFNEKYIWCIFNRYKYIITLYPMKIKDRLLITENKL